MLRMLLLIVAMLLLQGCSASSKHVYLQDGTEAHRIECEGVTPCHDKAGELCRGKGYTMIDQSAGPLRGGSTNRSIIVVKCRK